MTYKLVKRLYSEHNNRRGNEMYIHARGIATSGHKLKWLQGGDAARCAGQVDNRKSGKAEYARKTGYPVSPHMLFVKTILMWCYMGVNAYVYY